MSLNNKCTYYKNIVDHVAKDSPVLTYPGKDVPIIDILTKQGYTNTELLNQVRNSGYKSEFYDKNKRKLSAACFSSLQDDLTIDRSDDNHLAHTGYMTFDIDSVDNPYLKTDPEAIKETIIDKIPHIAYIGKSVSNIGYWGLIKIFDKSDHYGHFRAIQEVFSAIGVEVDKKVYDISRLRFIAFDPDYYINDDAPVFHDTVQVTEHTTNLPYYERRNVNDEFFLAACKWIEAKHDISFQKGSIHNYLLYLYGLLRSAHVSREQCLNWIYNNLIDEREITTNCLEEPKWLK